MLPNLALPVFHSFVHSIEVPDTFKKNNNNLYILIFVVFCLFHNLEDEEDEAILLRELRSLAFQIL